MFKVDKVKPIDGSCSFPVATDILLASQYDSLPGPKNKPENCNSWRKYYWSQRVIENESLRAVSFSHEILLFLFRKVERLSNEIPLSRFKSDFTK